MRVSLGVSGRAAGAWGRARRAVRPGALAGYVHRRQQQALAALFGPVQHHPGRAHAAGAERLDLLLGRGFGREAAERQAGLQFGIGRGLEGDPELAQFRALARHLLDPGEPAHVDDPAGRLRHRLQAPGAARPGLQRGAQRGELGLLQRRRGQAFGRPRRLRELRLQPPQLLRGQDPQAAGPDLLPHALRLRLLRRADAPGQQQALRPGVEGAVGQQQGEDEQAQHGVGGIRPPAARSPRSC